MSENIKVSKEEIEKNKAFAKKMYEEHKNNPNLKIEIFEEKVTFIPQGNLKSFSESIDQIIILALTKDVPVSYLINIVNEKMDYLKSMFISQKKGKL